MTQPTPISPDEQHRLVGEMTKMVLAQVPEGWREIIVDYMTIGKKVNVGGLAVMRNGSTERFRPQRELAPLISELRRGMYTEDGGAWYSFRLGIEPPDTFTIQYNWNEQPPFPSMPDRDQFVLEQERFPRAEENMPEWFRRGLLG